ncbi:hypothetical protein LAZ67_16002940 [Cordylochernes scorpioides]|uniref:Uncharacterized protein n=1 Tax=Cordylochernes scorpioides TaxID=51811 RepID=A0ABY6LCQ1_9ARAC|nr:hypothetical protein LAZ67_16002940 [Cordylochernes scorpioides]
MFAIQGGIYSITAPLWGKLCDWGINSRYLGISGCMFTLVCLILIGPLPFLPIDTAFVGPSVGGVLLEKVGFRSATVYLFVIEVALIVLLIANTIYRKVSKQQIVLLIAEKIHRFAYRRHPQLPTEQTPLVAQGSFKSV